MSNPIVKPERIELRPTRKFTRGGIEVTEFLDSPTSDTWASRWVFSNRGESVMVTGVGSTMEEARDHAQVKFDEVTSVVGNP